MATILVIDDEDSIRHLLKDVLEKAKHRVLEARDGREGLTLYQKSKVDLVLMDILMPGTDGLEATLQLTREYLDAKIIAMTGADINIEDDGTVFIGSHEAEGADEAARMIEEIARFVPLMPSPYTREDADEWVERCAEVWRTGEAFPFAIVVQMPRMNSFGWYFELTTRWSRPISSSRE